MNAQYLDIELRRLRMENERLQADLALSEACIKQLLEEIKSLQPRSILGTLKVPRRI